MLSVLYFEVISLPRHFSALNQGEMTLKYVFVRFLKDKCTLKTPIRATSWKVFSSVYADKDKAAELLELLSQTGLCLTLLIIKMKVTLKKNNQGEIP